MLAAIKHVNAAHCCCRKITHCSFTLHELLTHHSFEFDEAGDKVIEANVSLSVCIAHQQCTQRPLWDTQTYTHIQTDRQTDRHTYRVVVKNVDHHTVCEHNSQRSRKLSLNNGFILVKRWCQRQDLEAKELIFFAIQFNVKYSLWHHSGRHR